MHALLAWIPILLALAPSPATTPSPRPSPVLPWIADDYPRALREARARMVPIFIEAWAPW